MPNPSRNARSLRATLYITGAFLYGLMLLLTLSVAGVRAVRLKAITATSSAPTVEESSADPSTGHNTDAGFAASMVIMGSLIGVRLMYRAAQSDR